MKRTSGVEVLKLFKQTDDSIPIIMVTGNTEIPVAETCLKQGAFSYVPKPFNLTTWNTWWRWPPSRSVGRDPDETAEPARDPASSARVACG